MAIVNKLVAFGIVIIAMLINDSGFNIFTVFIITDDDLSNVYTVEEAVQEIGFGVFQVLLTLFSGAIWVIILTCVYTAIT